jgi:hypothetical protein
VTEEQRGAGEIKCFACDYALTGQEVRCYAPSPGVSTRAEALALEKAVVGMSDWRWCPQCDYGGFVDFEPIREQSVAAAEACFSLFCEGCGHEWCRLCELPARCHRPTAVSQRIDLVDERKYKLSRAAAADFLAATASSPSADTSPNLAEHQQDEAKAALDSFATVVCADANAAAWLPCEEAKRVDATSKWLGHFAKRCPSCRVVTERDGGCSHMRCKICSFEWCWFCEQKYTGRYTFASKCPCKPES